MTESDISGIAPFFIVRDLTTALAFYSDRLGFDVTFQEPADAPFFGIVNRGGAMIMLKSVGVEPLPNYKREPAERWDAYVSVPDPDALAAEFASRNVEFSEPLKDTHDGLRGFELKECRRLCPVLWLSPLLGTITAGEPTEDKHYRKAA